MADPFKLPKVEDWHPAMKTWKELKDDGLPALLKRKPAIFSGLVETPARPTNLLEMYLGQDVRQIYQDLEQRPDHYSDRQKEIIRNLMYAEHLAAPVTDEEKNELLLHFMRPTKLEEQSQQLQSKLRGADDEPIILSDGTSLDESGSAPSGTFEAQDDGDFILI
jgi:hypothetical protein